MGSGFEGKRLHAGVGGGGGSAGTLPAFPRCIVLRSGAEGPIGSLSPFVMGGRVCGIIGRPRGVGGLEGGGLLVGVTEGAQSEGLLGTTGFFRVPVECFPRGSLGASRGVVRCPDLGGVSEDEMAEGLRSQGVASARRVGVGRDGGRVGTNVLVLTFGTSVLPGSMRVGCLVVGVGVCVPSPVLCGGCRRCGRTCHGCGSQCGICPGCGGRGCCGAEAGRCRGQQGARAAVAVAGLSREAVLFGNSKGMF